MVGQMKERCATAKVVGEEGTQGTRVHRGTQGYTGGTTEMSHFDGCIAR